MKPEVELRYHQILAGVIEDVLRCRSGPIRVPDLATSAGFSRFHLARLFHQTTAETLEEFLRRIRLERSAYMLTHSAQTVLEISIDSGYRSPEAFSRAFRQAFASLPTHFRKEGRTWKLTSPSDLHWNADWAIVDRSGTPYGEEVISMPTRYACVWRAVGNYSLLEHAWERFGQAYAGQIPAAKTFITIYLDNMWTHPVCHTMRADIGWLCSPSDTPPRGMRRIVIPAGCYAVSRFVDRTERNDGWSYMSGRYVTARKSDSYMSYDEYAAWPLPFPNVKTRIFVSVDPGPRSS